MFSSRTVYNSEHLHNPSAINKSNSRASVSKYPPTLKNVTVSSKSYADTVKASSSNKFNPKSSVSCSKSSVSQGPAVSFGPSIKSSVKPTVSYKHSNGPRSPTDSQGAKSAESRVPIASSMHTAASKKINNNSVKNISKSKCYEETIVYDILDEKVSLPYIKVSTSHCKAPLRFLIDSGSSICLIRESSLSPKPQLENHIIKFKGINDVDSYAKTKGKFILSINLKDNDVLPFYFHVIGDDINLPYDGIIGTSFMKAYKVNVLYSKSRLEISDDPSRYFNMIMTRPSYTVPAHCH